MENRTKAGNLPTAEEFLKNHYEVNVKNHFLEFDKGGLETYAEYAKRKPLKTLEQAVIEFAKLHVQAQREAIKKKATIKKRYDGNIAKEYWEDIVDEQSIDNAYDLNNIK